MNTARNVDMMQNVSIDKQRMIAEVPLVDGMIYTVVDGKLQVIEPPTSGHGNYNFCYQEGQVIDVVKSERVRYKKAKIK
ncbi:DUF3954 domain-containing protein [Terribacillus sp. JSM ZJ617]|uniref:DUF3954 domain-containing protein n=1 Tax=Terribacillus sp. JSM ZJ617 TaxID=3342119 RepID=UPI0035A98129